MAHAISSACAGGAVYAATASPLAAGSCVLAGVFIDLDHLVDFFALAGERFTVRGFLAYCNEVRGRRLYLPLHSIELLALWALWASGNAHPAGLGALVGGGLHLLLDQVGNRKMGISPWFYFLSYRALQGFRKDRLLRRLALPLLLALSAPAWCEEASSLSVFEPAGGSCRWLRLDPASKNTSVLATFKTECAGAAAAWSHDRVKALVWFDPYLVDPSSRARGRAAGPALAEVYLDGSRSRSFALPAKGQAKDVGYGRAGRPVVLTLDAIPEITVGAGTSAQAYAFVLSRKNAWSQVETRSTSIGWEEGQGTAALETSVDLGPRTRLMADPRPSADTAGFEEERRLHAFAPVEDGQGTLKRLKGTRIPVYFVEAAEGGATGLIAFEREGKLLAPPGLGFGLEDRVSLVCRGSFLLVTTAVTGSSPRLYSLASGKLLYSSDTASGVVFWPY